MSQQQLVLKKGDADVDNSVTLGWELEDLTVPVSADSLIRTDGTLIAAEHCRDTNIRIVNGVSFTGNSSMGDIFTSSSGTAANNYTAGNASTALTEMLDRFRFESPSTTPQIIETLPTVAGRTYLLQYMVLISEARSASASEETLTLEIDGYETAQYARKDNLLATFTFIASADNLGLVYNQQDGNNGTVGNFFQLREL